jgi:integrase
MSHYLASLQGRFSPQTVLAYGQALRLFTQVLREHFFIQTKNTPITAITITWASTYLEFLQQNHSPETEHLYSRAIIDFYQYLENQTSSLANDLTTTLSAYITQHRRPKHYHTPTLPLDAIEAIVAHATTVSPPLNTDDTTQRDTLRLLRDKAFLLTLAYTGLRVSEICSLRIANLDLHSKAILLSEDLPLQLPTTVIAAIDLYLTQRKPLDNAQQLFHASHLPLFARHDKKAGRKILPISRWTAANIVNFWVSTALPPATCQQLIRHNTPITPHTFRHYFVVTTLHNTGNLQQTQALARHADTATTRRYLHLTKPSISSKPSK